MAGLRITVVTVGKLKERFWKDAVAEYAKRLGGYCQLHQVEVPDRDPARAGGEQRAMEEEGVGILRAVPEGAHCTLLAIDGTQRSSEQLSARLDQLALDGAASGGLAFVIGGSTGVSPAVRARANETLSFGPITLPHNLARVVLLEQLYRACKISRNEPYHK